MLYFFALLFIILPYAATQINFQSSYQGMTVKGTVGSSVDLTWSYSGNVQLVSWGLALAGSSAAFDNNQVLKSLTTSGSVTLIPPSAYIGRVSGSRSGGQATFTLRNLTKDDARYYGCKIEPTSPDDSSKFDKVELVVEEAPRFTHPTQTNASYNDGSPVDISCTAQGTPDPDVRWIYNGLEKSSGSKTAHLIFSPISKVNAGTYTCRANNSAGIKEKQLHISVNYAAIIKSVTPLITRSWIGQTVTLKCVADGVPTPSLTWKNPDGSEIKRVTATKNTVDVVMKSDQDFGRYTCEAKNVLIAAAASTVQVQQTKAPGSPTITVNIRATSITVKWTVPADDGGSPITGYRVVILQGDTAIRNETTTVREMEVEGLIKSTNYTVKVYARNKAFYGEATPNIIKTKYEGPPEAVEIADLPSETKEATVTIIWSEPRDNGAPITQYIVYQRTVSEESTPRQWNKVNVITDVPLREVNITLQKGKNYEFIVTATNKFGESMKEEDKIKKLMVFGDVPSAVVFTYHVKNDKITLKWQMPNNNGAVITQYSVYQRIGNDEQWTSIGAITDNCRREYVVSEVDEGRKYEFVVTATNKYGESSKEGNIKRIKVPGIFTIPTESRTGSSCDDEKKTLHAVYMTVILLLLISNLVLIYLLWRMRSRSALTTTTKSENSGKSKKCRTCGDVIAMNPILKTVQMEADTQSSSVAQKIDAPTYAAPVGADYMPLNPSTKNWEISREQVNIIKVIGKGAFSKVSQATVRDIRGSQKSTTVAVKMLKANAPASDKKDLLSELELMKKLKPHPHVIKLVGCVTESDPLLILIEYVPFGDLLGYLRKSRGLNDTYFKDPDVKPQSSLTAGQLMKFAWQVADGMFYLSSKKIIHRDLAARNVLVGEGEKCKVTDFGMARNVQQDDIYNRTSRGRLPVKWTAYEALMYGTYTTQSDVWSFGVLLYEVLTVGGSPYPEINPREIARKLQEGYRMPKPRHVEDKLYQIMLRCWEENPVDRPTFDKLRKTMKEMERNHKTYVNLNQYDHSLYANVQDLTAE